MKRKRRMGLRLAVVTYAGVGSLIGASEGVAQDGVAISDNPPNLVRTGDPTSPAGAPITGPLTGAWAQQDSNKGFPPPPPPPHVRVMPPLPSPWSCIGVCGDRVNQYIGQVYGRELADYVQDKARSIRIFANDPTNRKAIEGWKSVLGALTPEVGITSRLALELKWPLVEFWKSVEQFEKSVAKVGMTATLDAFAKDQLTDQLKDKAKDVIKERALDYAKEHWREWWSAAQGRQLLDRQEANYKNWHERLWMRLPGPTETAQQRDAFFGQQQDVWSGRGHGGSVRSAGPPARSDLYVDPKSFPAVRGSPRLDFDPSVFDKGSQPTQTTRLQRVDTGGIGNDWKPQLTSRGNLGPTGGGIGSDWNPRLQSNLGGPTGGGIGNDWNPKLQSNLGGPTGGGIGSDWNPKLQSNLGGPTGGGIGSDWNPKLQSNLSGPTGGGVGSDWNPKLQSNLGGPTGGGIGSDWNPQLQSKLGPTGGGIGNDWNPKLESKLGGPTGGGIGNDWSPGAIPGQGGDGGQPIGGGGITAGPNWGEPGGLRPSQGGGFGRQTDPFAGTSYDIWGRTAGGPLSPTLNAALSQIAAVSPSTALSRTTALSQSQMMLRQYASTLDSLAVQCDGMRCGYSSQMRSLANQLRSLSETSAARSGTAPEPQPGFAGSGGQQPSSAGLVSPGTNSLSRSTVTSAPEPQPGWAAGAGGAAQPYKPAGAPMGYVSAKPGSYAWAPAPSNVSGPMDPTPIVGGGIPITGTGITSGGADPSPSAGVKPSAVSTSANTRPLSLATIASFYQTHPQSSFAAVGGMPGTGLGSANAKANFKLQSVNRAANSAGAKLNSTSLTATSSGATVSTSTAMPTKVTTFSPVVHTPTPSVKVSTPAAVHVNAPSVHVNAATVHTPTIHVNTPTIHVNTPTVRVNTPTVRVATPTVRTPNVTVKTPNVTVRTPTVRVPTVKVPNVSDIRLKRDIVELGRLASGLHLYRYRYHWSDTQYVGVMAQEVSAMMPEAVTRGPDGYLRVDYGRLGRELLTWDEWLLRDGETLLPAH